MLGLKHTTVKLVPYNYKWSYLFQEEVIKLRRALNDRKLQVEHVGSTALNNIAAKPILDIFIPCQDLTTVADYVEPLAKLGYELVTDASTYKLFIKGSEEARTHHLTFTSSEGTYWQETIQFRDHLLEHPETAKAYEVEKIALAEQYADSRRNYSSNKARFIQSVLREISSTVNSTVAVVQAPQLLPIPLPLLSNHVNPKVPFLPVAQSDIDTFVNSKQQSLKASQTPRSQFQEQSTKQF